MHKVLSGVNIIVGISRLNIHPNIRWILKWQNIKYLLWDSENRTKAYVCIKLEISFLANFLVREFLVNTVKLSKK